jgi:hypothetical protein
MLEKYVIQGLKTIRLSKIIILIHTSMQLLWYIYSVQCKLNIYQRWKWLPGTKWALCSQLTTLILNSMHFVYNSEQSRCSALSKIPSILTQDTMTLNLIKVQDSYIMKQFQIK